MTQPKGGLQWNKIMVEKGRVMTPQCYYISQRIPITLHFMQNLCDFGILNRHISAYQSHYVAFEASHSGWNKRDKKAYLQ